MADTEHGRAVIRKVAWRLIPILGLCYFAAFLDRVNIGFAALTMSNDLGLTPAAFGFGAGIFFLGYILCEVPSNIVMGRVGARLWIARIMITWGVLSAMTAFVVGERSFYVVRILLGIAEAGFFPGMVVYLTLWFPRADRARMFGLFNMAVPLSSVIGAPISVLILTYLDRVGGFAGWQWLFVIEALPAIIMGMVVLTVLPDRPDRAGWLAPADRTWLAATLTREQADREADERFTVLGALTDRRVLLMCLVAVGLVVGTTGVAVWMPQIVKAFGLTTMQTGFVAAIPSLAMAIAMVASGRHADRTGERIWHVAAPFLASAAGFLLAAAAASPVMGLIGLTVGAAGVGAATPNIWVFPTTLLTGGAAAAGVALINSVGSTGGFFGPAVIGWIRQVSGSFSGSLVFLAATCVMAALVALLLGGMMRHLLTAGAQARSAHALPGTAR